MGNSGTRLLQVYYPSEHGSAFRGSLCDLINESVGVSAQTSLLDIYESVGLPWGYPFVVRQSACDEDLSQYSLSDFEGGPLVTCLSAEGRISWQSGELVLYADLERGAKEGVVTGDDIHSIVVSRAGGAMGGFDFLFALIDTLVSQAPGAVLGAASGIAAHKASNARERYRRHLILRWLNTGMDGFKLDALLSRRRLWAADALKQYVGLDAREEAEYILRRFGFREQEGLWHRSTLAEAIEDRNAVMSAAQQPIEAPEWVEEMLSRDGDRDPE